MRHPAEGVYTLCRVCDRAIQSFVQMSMFDESTDTQSLTVGWTHVVAARHIPEPKPFLLN